MKRGEGSTRPCRPGSAPKRSGSGAIRSARATNLWATGFLPAGAGGVARSSESIPFRPVLFHAALASSFLFWNLSDFMASGRGHASRSGHGTALAAPKVSKGGPCFCVQRE
jgi:hypothetical protein